MKSTISIAGALLALSLTACSKDEAVEAAAAVALPESIVHIETVQRTDADQLVIPYEKYRLSNGLTVILHEDNSDPLVHVDITYHVGSGREEVGKSGFAHFFEHMMFQGSDNVADEEHFKIITESGGTLNGTTNSDRTNYFETVPSNQLEKMLWLEADRMGYFLDSVTQEKFEIQRETVKNERGQRVDNQPYGRLFEMLGETLYPAGHPYSWSTIGYLEDLDRVNVNDLKQFFLRWYGPNNATLTIGGKMDKAQTLAWVDKYFGPIPRGPEVEMPVKPVVTVDADRYRSMQDDVALPLIYMAFPTVSLYHEDEAPLDVLMFILGQGETSLLYKNMVKNGYAVQAGANHGCQELSCTFTVVALPNPASGKTLADLEQIARSSLQEFEERGVEEDDLIRVKTTISSGLIYGLESVSGKVGQLASYETFTGNPNFIAKDVSRYEDVTAEDVMRVYREYILGKPAVVLSIVPEGQPDAAARADNWVMPERELPDYQALSEDDLELRVAVDDFDRSIMPGAGENPTIVVPDIWQADLDNGVSVMGAQNLETPTTAMQLIIRAGQRDESLQQLGLASLTAAMMNEASTESSAEEISNRLQKLGSTVSFGAGNAETVLTIRSLSKNLDETLDIARERLLQPKFDEGDFKRVQDQVIQGIRASQKNPSTIASAVYQMILFGQDNSFSHLNAGSEASVAALTLDDVKSFYATYYSPAIARMTSVSSVARDELLEKLTVLDGWQGEAVEREALLEFPGLKGGTLYFVDNPDAAQSEVYVGKRGLTYDSDGDYYRAQLVNFPLGGMFNARLMLNLREDKGYTYGAYSSFSGNDEYGTFTAKASVRSDATVDSIVQFTDEIGGFHEAGMSETELAFMRRALGQSDARRYETPSQKLGFLSQIQRYGLDSSYVDRQGEILESIGLAELNSLATEHLDLDDMVILVVGDKTSLWSGLQELGYEMVELDVDGNVI